MTKRSDVDMGLRCAIAEKFKKSSLYYHREHYLFDAAPSTLPDLKKLLLFGIPF